MLPRGLLALSPVLLLVCGSFGCHSHHAAPIDLASRVAVVDVGGFVGQPGPVEIPREGLTLYQAIIRARGISFQSLGLQIGSQNTQAFVFVRLHRGREVWTFPRAIVQNDLAGLIQLVPGDIVDVVRPEDTSLSLTIAPVGPSAGNIEVLGDYPFVGTIGIEDLDKKISTPGATQPKGGELSLDKLRKLDALESVGLTSSANVIVLTRVNPRNGALTEHYLIPADTYGPTDFDNSLSGEPVVKPADEVTPSNPVIESGGALAPIVANDRILFTTLPEIPIIKAGMIAPVIKRLIESGVPPEECHRHVRQALATSR